jgi:hypothetical protein
MELKLTRRKDGPRALKARLLDLRDLDQRTKSAQLAMRVKADIIADLGGEEQLSTLAPSSEQRQSAVIIPFPRHRIKRPVKKENAPDEAPHPAPRSA